MNSQSYLVLQLFSFHQNNQAQSPLLPGICSKTHYGRIDETNETTVPCYSKPMDIFITHAIDILSGEFLHTVI